ncbi:MAG: hypothetical protein FLDDKLPJ_03410 [Phycisphaerae bacterium]|nr:hypothetical protein [Phycisphaerae bacterium]
MNRPNVIITGMARSGTSMTAGIFAGQGYFVGEQAAPASDANPLGYFEARDLLDLNVDLLRRAGFPHHNTWRYEPVTREVRDRIRAIAPDERHRRFLAFYNERSPWVWKDVRLCFTLPFWLPLLDRATTRFILVHRRSEGIYHSIVRNHSKILGELSPAAIADLARDHLDAARAALAECAVTPFELHYERCVQQPDAVAAELAEFVGFPLTAKDLRVRAELNHDTFRDRVLTRVRDAFEDGALGWVKPLVRRLVPQRLLEWAFPEHRREGERRRRAEAAGKP